VYGAFHIPGLCAKVGRREAAKRRRNENEKEGKREIYRITNTNYYCSN
jgi:hypothetical protein